MVQIPSRAELANNSQDKAAYCSRKKNMDFAKVLELPSFSGIGTINYKSINLK